MVSTVLHLIQVIIAFFAGMGVYRSYKKGGSVNPQLRDFSKFFFLFGIYQMFLIPFLFTKNLALIGWSYNIAILLFFIMLSLALKIPLLLRNTPLLKIKILRSILVAFGFLIVIVQIYDSRLPIIDSSGFIFWNTNPLMAWLINIAAFLTALTWVYVFGKNLSKISNLKEKIKAILLICAALAFGLSGLTYFHSNYWLTMTAFIAIFAGFFFILIMLLIPKNESRQ